MFEDLFTFESAGKAAAMAGATLVLGILAYGTARLAGGARGLYAAWRNRLSPLAQAILRSMEDSTPQSRHYRNGETARLGGGDLMIVFGPDGGVKEYQWGDPVVDVAPRLSRRERRRLDRAASDRLHRFLTK